jgi:hypothetical protein
MDRSTAELIELISGSSREVAYDLAEPFLRVLMVAHATCGGDLEKAMIMMAITLRSSRHPAFRELGDDDVEDRDVLPGFGTNMRSIADSLGVAKETVRRKVQQLIEAGWVVRQGRHLCYSADGYRAVEGVRRAIIEMYARGFRVVTALERRAPTSRSTTT